MKFNPELIQTQIRNLLLQYPELEDDEQLRADMIEGETKAFEFLTKLEDYREDTVDLIEAAEARIAVLKARKDRLERREEFIRAVQFKVMDSAGLRKLELATATLSIRNVAPSVIITDEIALPDAACKFTRKPDRTLIKEMLSRGPVNGATMSNGGTSLTIHTK